ncbi:hypothetical protein GGTG_05108 [Gaeumannomyces tritici R3-111a-1]|uniref:Uncharacterized protein n=1 Tax=Gaeumannomyces tritici (strain R3-111a-1) TaxID=644352 RepID=J3NUZ9_GAET3|nr:hypothetical protein GGTG_05108 [Gaeumannomyces tritici R3-111a-1]EJT75171.1 hypothetical protein GGTG_05108 [Gaeumannomyces tritici R3-111a-1]
MARQHRRLWSPGLDRCSTPVKVNSANGQLFGGGGSGVVEGSFILGRRSWRASRREHAVGASKWNNFDAYEWRPGLSLGPPCGIHGVLEVRAFVKSVRQLRKCKTAASFRLHAPWGPIGEEDGEYSRVYAEAKLDSDADAVAAARSGVAVVYMHLDCGNRDSIGFQHRASFS